MKKRPFFKIALCLQACLLTSIAVAGEIGEMDWGSWQGVAGLPEARFGQVSAVLGGAIYGAGGQDGVTSAFTNLFRFDGTAWDEVEGLPAARAHMAGGVLGGALYAVGGTDDSGPEVPKTNLYYFDGATWTEAVRGVPVGMRSLGGASLSNLWLVAAGGLSNNNVALTNVYRLSGTNWTAVNGLPGRRYDSGSAVFGDYLYVIGGITNFAAPICYTNVFRFDGTSWGETVGLPDVRSSMAAAVFRGDLYAIGGSDGTSVLDDVLKFDGTEWTPGVSLPVACAYPSASELNGVLYVIGGQDDVGAGMTNVIRYPARAAGSGISHENGSWTGGYQVAISGTGLGDGSDITNVTICGVSVASIQSQTDTNVVVIAGVAGTNNFGLGDVRVFSTSCGESVRSNAFTYTRSIPVVLGTNGAAIASGESPSVAKGADFGAIPWSISMTNILAVTNSGSETLNISGWTTNGTGKAAFSVSALPASLAPGEVASFRVVFSPTVIKAYSATLNIANDSPTVPNYIVNIQGEGSARPMLTVSPGVFSHTIMSGQVFTNTDIVQVGNVGNSADIGFVASIDVPWLGISAGSGTIGTNSSTNLTVSYLEDLTTHLVVTSYTGKITFTGTNTISGEPAMGSPQVVEVTVTVNPRPQLSINKTVLTNSVMHAYDASTQRFDVWNGTGFYPMNFTVSDSASWLLTSISSGTSTGERYTVNVRYSTTGLDVGIYTATITIVGQDAAYGMDAIDSPQTIMVTMDVKPVAVLASDNGFGFTNTIRKGATVDPQTFRIYNGCLAPLSVLSYSVASDAAWLSVSPDAVINVPGSADTITVSYNTASLAPGLHSGEIVVNGVDEGTGMDAINSPMRIAVKVFVEETKPLDFSGDDVAELVVYHESSGMWHILNMDGQSWSERFGGSSYTPAPGDYDGDGMTELGVYRAKSGSWYSKPLESYTILVVGKFGGEEYRPVRGDFDGDGRQDFAVYNENTGRWYIMSPDGTLILWDYAWGGAGYTPLAGDFSGDGVSDLAAYNESTGEWYIITTDGILIAWGYPWGGVDFTPLVGDYDGDGLADLAAYYRPYGWWFVTSLSEGLLAWAMPWGSSGFTPLVGDYNGDGAADLTVYYDGLWYICTVDGTVIQNGLEWGGRGYIPVGM